RTGGGVVRNVFPWFVVQAPRDRTNRPDPKRIASPDVRNRICISQTTGPRSFLGPRSFKHPSASTRTLPHPLAGSRSVPDLPLRRRTTADPTADRLARRGPSPRGLPAPQATPAPHGRRRVAVPPDAWSLRNAGTAADRGRTSSGTATPTAATGSGAGRPETPW